MIRRLEYQLEKAKIQGLLLLCYFIYREFQPMAFDLDDSFNFIIRLRHESIFDVDGN